VGYTHYFRRVNELNKENFKKVADDFKLIKSAMELKGIKIASWDGTGEPEINYDKIAFNGVQNCGHKDEDLGIITDWVLAFCTRRYLKNFGFPSL